ncbi:uncharacterized protein [Saccopteryx bilineata]|uniref:uncharacterized protein n=1 Tax=Saccopteryx bilineata TaxID=59482 RepID=UPI00338F52DE
MFLCCFPSFRGSGRKKARSERSSCCWRPWRRRHRRRQSPSGTRKPQVTMGSPGQGHQSPDKDSVEELPDRFTYALSRYDGPVRQARSSVQWWSQVGAGRTKEPEIAGSSHNDIVEKLFHGPDHFTYRIRVQQHQADSTVQGTGKCVAELWLHSREVCRMRALQGGTLEKVGASMLPAFPAGNIPCISTFLSIHPAFSGAQQFLDQLFVG